MEKRKTAKSIFILLAFAILFTGIVSAQNTDDVRTVTNPITIFFNNLFHSQSYSIVGTNQGCGGTGGTVSDSWTITTAGTSLTAGHNIPSNAIVDVFTNGWTPLVEGPASFFNGWTCGSASVPCNVQVYNCPSQTCTSKTTITCPTWSGTSYFRCPGESGIPYYSSSYSYCPAANIHTCYYKPSGASTCSSYDYQNVNSCSQVGNPSGTYNGLQLYESQSICEAQTCSPSWQTGTWSTCNSGTQIRTVTDSNNCGVTTNKPATSQACTVTNHLATKLQVISISVPEAIAGTTPGITRPFKVKLKNTGTTTETVNIEAGFYTQDYATSIAKLPQQNLFSVSTISDVPNCVGNEGFIKTKQLTIMPGDTQEVEIDQAPLFAYMTKPIGAYQLSGVQLVSYIGIYKTCCQKLAGFDGCADNTGGFVQDLNGNSIYKVNWNYVNPDTVNLLSDNIVCSDGSVYGNIDYKAFSQDVITISRNYLDCIHFTFYEQNGTVDVNATNQFNLNAGSTLSGAKKVSLTKDEITIAPTPQLLASSCISKTECFDRENYTVTCNTLASLRTEGVLPQVAQDSLLDTGKKLTSGALTGAGIGAVVCAGSTLYAIFTPEPVTKAVSASIAAFCTFSIPGGAVIGASISNLYSNPNDKLVQAFKTADANSVGLCTATPGNGGGLCIPQINNFMSPITHLDCQTNTIIFFAIILFGLVLILKK